MRQEISYVAEQINPYFTQFKRATPASRTVIFLFFLFDYRC